MALISRELGLLFIMAPHTGCTAVGRLLRADFGATWLPDDHVLDAHGKRAIPRKHTTLVQLTESGLLSPKDREQLTIASTIRNPFDSNVSSWYRWYRKLSPDHPEFNPVFSERSETEGAAPPEAIEAARGVFERWLVERYQPKRRHQVRGRYRHVQAFRWTVGSDVVMRYERLQADLDALLARLGAQGRHASPQVNVLRKRKREKRPYQDWYTPKSRSIVEGAFAEDLAEYGYTFEPG